MERSKKNLIVWILSAICFICSIFSLAFMGKKTEIASAASNTSTFEMVGASVRTSQMDGIRFVAKIDADELDGYGEAKYGVILVPQEMADDSLTVSYDGGKYIVSDEDAIVIEGGELWNDALLAQYEIDEGYAAFSCALIANQGDGSSAVRFPVEFYNRPLTAVAFIIPETGATLYTQKVSRSMAYVALVESLKPTYQGNVYIEDIVDGVTADLSVNGGMIDNTKTAYAPVLTLGGLDAETSSLVSVSYDSDNTPVAKIVNGKVQAVADGTATITATVSVGGTAEFTATEKLTVSILKATVTATSENTAKGTVTGGGTVEQGTSVTLKATANEGYTFNGWYNGSTKVSSSATYTFTATSDITLQAKWKTNTYQVTLTAGAGGSVSGAGTYNYNTSVTITATPDTGYHFVKWSDGVTTASRDITVTGALDLTATFAINTYTVSFNVNGGSGTVASQTVNYNSTATAPTTEPTKTGYTFKGWATSSTGTTAFDFATKITGNKTLYAIWEINTYTVTFNSKGGSSVTAKTTNYNTAISEPTAPTKTGYTFKHWSKTDGGSTAYDFSSQVTSSFTLYAVWTINTYTVSFNVNGGSGTVASQTINYNAKPTAPSEPTRTGYTFQGWGTSSSATTAVDVTTVAITGNKTYYAIWEINTYTVTFNANSGSGGSTQTVNYNAKPTAPSNPTRTGYTFQGWGTSSSATTAVDVTTVAITGNKTYYAIWKINTYTVTFDANSGSGGSTQTVNYNAKPTAPSNPTRTGYTFQGWGTSASATTTVDVTATAIKANKTYYAVWKINTYTVTLAAGTGVSAVSGNGTYDYNTSVTLGATVKTGYTWKNWTGSSTQTTKAYNFKITGNVSFTANATANTYSVKYYGNNSTSGSMSDSSHTYDTAKTLTANAFKRTGYTFLGWSTSSSATTATYADKASVKNLTSTNGDTVNLYAVWKVNSYTLTLTAGTGGTVTGGGTYDYGKSVTIKATPSTGYDFTKWSDGNTSASRTITITGNTTLSATFTAKKFTVTATAATIGGSVSGGGSISYGSSVTLKATTDSGYTFLGWYDSNDKKVETAASYTFTVKNAVTLKAKWKAGNLSSSEETWRSKQGYNYFYYTQLGTDVMPIGAWCAPPPNTSVTVNGVKKTFSTNQITQANYNTIKESGINAIYGLYDSVWSNDNNSTRENWVKNALNYAQNAGMVYVVRDGNAYTALSDKGNAAWSQFEYYMNHPAYGGTLFVDEPGYEQFDEIGNAMKLWNEHEVYGDNKLALVNNLPNYSSAPQLYYGIATKETSAPVDYTGANFENWVRAYLDITGAKVYSYDFYPYAGYGNNYMKDPNGYGFFDNISAVRKVCMEKNVPFWTFNQSGSAFGATRQLTQAETAMQVNLSLAYGAKGIQWFNYWQPLESADTDDALCALVDHYGNKTRYYDMVKKVNAQVAAADEFLMKSKSTGIIEIGKSILGSVPSADKVTKYGALTSASGIGNAIIGCFEYRDKGYVYYVSSSDWTEDAVVNLNFNGVYNIQKIQDAASHWYDSNAVTVHVPAGEGVLLYVPKTAQSVSTHTITVNNNNATAGSAYGAGSYKNGAIVTIAAQANPGYKFLGWYSGNSIFTSSPVYHFTAGSSLTLTAYWQEDTNPAMLNDCEQNLGWITDHWGNGLALSTSHVTQGTYSAKSDGVMKIRLGEHPLSLAELKATYKAIRIHIYLDASSTTLMLGNWGKAYKDLTRGSNYVIIKTADLTSDYYFIENGSGILYLSTTAVTSYVDNVVGLKSTVMLNDCDTTDGVQTSVTPTLSTTNKVQGNYSVAATCTVGGWWLNLRVADASVSLAELQATYSTITFHVYSNFPGEVIGTNQNTLWFYDLATGAWGKNLAIFTNGTLHAVTINTSDITSSMYVQDAWGSYICMSVGGASTLYIDNVQGVLK